MDGGSDDGVVWLIGLEEDVSVRYVATADSANDLSEEMKSALLSGIIRKRETGVGLDDGNGGEVGKVQTASDGLGADDEINLVILNDIVIGIQSF